MGFLVNSYNFVVPTPDPDQYWDWSSSTGWTLSRSTISGNKFNWNDDATGTNTFLWSYTAINTLDDNENTIRYQHENNLAFGKAKASGKISMLKSCFNAEPQEWDGTREGLEALTTEIDVIEEASEEVATDDS